MKHISKYLISSLVLISNFSFAQSNPNTLTENQQNTIKNSVNSAYKIMAIEKFCTDKPDIISNIYAQSLIFSNAFINSKKFQPNFSKNLSERVENNIKDLEASGSKCPLNNAGQLSEFRQNINSNIINSFYHNFSDDKTLQKDIKENKDKPVVQFLEARFFNEKYEINVKNSNDNKDALLTKYVTAISGYKNLKQCYKKLNMTEDNFKKLNPQIGSFLIKLVNGINLMTTDKIKFITTGFVLADTLHVESCEDSKDTLELFNKLTVTKQTS